MNMNLKQKKNDSNCTFDHVSLLIPYPSKFLVVCHCIIIFHGIHKAINDQSCKLTFSREFSV